MAGVIVHEWIEPSGGAEKVLDAMAAEFPDADIVALWNDDPSRFAPGRVAETVLARTPLRRHKALALPVEPFVWRHLPGGADYEWMLVSSHLFAHHARFHRRPRTSPTIVYTHSPARYLWNPEIDPRGARFAVRAVAPLFRSLDRRRAQEPDLFIANSAFVRDRIRSAWGRDAQVIPPPVDVTRIQATPDWAAQVRAPAERAVLDELPAEFLLGASRFVPYKRLDLVIATAAEVGLPVVIAGRGPDEHALRRMAADSGADVRFVISPSDELLFALYQRARALVFPPVEDFGIIPVEAMALGTPVICRRQGGQSESVDDTVGTLTDDTAPAGWARAVRAALDRADPTVSAAAARRFDTSVFRHRLRAVVDGERAS